MTGQGEESFALEHTPTWAVAAVCIVFIALSLLMQRGLQRLGTWLLSSHKRPLYEALEKMKEELMLLGFISLLLTAAQNPMSKLCMPSSWANQMLPCHFHNSTYIPTAHSPSAPAAATHSPVHRRSTLFTDGYADKVQGHRKMLSLSNYRKSRRVLSGMTSRHFCSEGHIPLMSTESLHQLHIFIFVMAVVHVFYSCFTMLFGFTQLRSWRKWEEETNVNSYNYPDEIKKSLNGEASLKISFRKIGFGSLRRQSTFVMSRTMNPWSTNPYGIWFVLNLLGSLLVFCVKKMYSVLRAVSYISCQSFFRQFGKSVTKSDYLTLRLGFIKNHNAPRHLNFHKYIMSSLEDDLKTVIGISGYLWVFVIFFMILNVHGWYAYFWMSFIPVLINLVIGTKLQHIITQLAMETAHTHGIVGVPIKPRDELFWFNNPHLLLYLIHFILFQNAFELAFCIWLVTTFGFNSCFFAKHGFIISRVIVGILAQVLCSYSTLPLYALVSQMGSHFKKAIFADPVSNAVADWRNKAKANIRLLHQSASHHTRKKENDHLHEAKGGNLCSNCHSKGHDYVCTHKHNLKCNSTLLRTSDGEVQSEAPQYGIPKPLKNGTKLDLFHDNPINERQCEECERLSLGMHVDKSELEENVEPSDAIAGLASNLKSDFLLGGAKTKVVFEEISSKENTSGSPDLWSLECSKCESPWESLKGKIVESNLLQSDEENLQLFNGDSETSIKGTRPKSPQLGVVQVLGKRNLASLNNLTPSSSGHGEMMNGPQTPQKVNFLVGPSKTLDKLEQIPSRELRKIKVVEVTNGLETSRPDLNTPELMMYTLVADELDSKK